MLEAERGTVWWDDPQGSATTVINSANIASKHKPVLMETTGWIVRDDADGISICNERYLEEGEWQYRGHTFIVRSLIKRVQKRRRRGRTAPSATVVVECDAGVDVPAVSGNETGGDRSG